jgi:hypothetical protein
MAGGWWPPAALMAVVMARPNSHRGPRLPQGMDLTNHAACLLGLLGVVIYGRCRAHTNWLWGLKTHRSCPPGLRLWPGRGGGRLSLIYLLGNDVRRRHTAADRARG